MKKTKSQEQLKTAGIKKLSKQGFFIDCSHEPFRHNDLCVVEHQKLGKLFVEKKEDGLYLDYKKIEFYVPIKEVHSSFSGDLLRKELQEDKSREILNANVLDQLITCSDLIPRDGKRGTFFSPIAFLGTIYYGSLRKSSLYFRTLWWQKNRWHSTFSHLDENWHTKNPIAIIIY